MRRRDFLIGSALGALVLASPRRLFAASSSAVADRLWIFFDANGAWDPTFFCDPKPGEGELFVHADAFQSQHLKTNAAGLSYAPFSPGDPYMDLAGNQPFFEKYADRLRVINGYDGQTNNHIDGNRSFWSGSLAAGNPSLGALIAAAHAELPLNQLPLAFLSTGGGFDGTMGLVPTTRVADTAPLLKLTNPNMKQTGQTQKGYHHPAALSLVEEAQEARTQRLFEAQGLPQIRAGLQRLTTARSMESSLSELKEAFACPDAAGACFLPEVNTSESPLLPAARVALAAMSAKLCVSATLSMAGFDSHSDHDNLDPASSGHRSRLRELFVAIDYVWERAEVLGLADKLVVVVGSDFGRTRYNAPKPQPGDPSSAPGKDHWPITSAMLMAKNGIIPAGVVGATTVDPLYNGVLATPMTVANNAAVLAPGGGEDTTLIRQVHLHHMLRSLAGLKGHPLAKPYPIWRPGDFPLPLIPGVADWENF